MTFKDSLFLLFFPVSANTYTASIVVSLKKQIIIQEEHEEQFALLFEFDLSF